MRTSRLLGSLALFATSSMFAVLPACSGEQKSGLMLAITTDMKAPKDVNAVAVTISTNNTIKHNVIGRVTPQGDILLPATLAVVQPDDPNATIRIRVMAFQERKARVLRDVRTSIPAGGRVALLRIPLNFVNDGSVSGEIPANVLPAANPGTLPPGSNGGGGGGGGNADGGAVSSDGGAVSSDGGSGAGTGSGSGSGSGDGLGSISGGDTFDPTVFVPNCPNPEHTWIDGECQDAYIDPNSLPDFDEKLVGAGDQPGVCFDTKTCFAQSIPLQGGATQTDANRPSGGTNASGGDSAGTPNPGAADASAPPPDPNRLRPQNLTFNADACTVQLDATVNPTNLNVAIVTRDTGECIRPGECYVPIDQGEGGWKLDGTTLKLPNFVCKLVTGKNLRLAYSTGCGTKHVENPVCAETAVTSPPDQPPVSGTDGGGPVASNARLVIPEAFATSVAVGGGDLYLAGANRIAQVPFGGSPAQAQPVAGIPGGSPLPWTFGVAPFGMVLTNGTNQVYAYPGSGQPTVIQLPDGATATSAAWIQQLGRYVIAAGPKGDMGGLYGAQTSVPSKLPLQFPYDPARQNDEAIVVGPTSPGFVYGTSGVEVIGCYVQAADSIICGYTNNFSSRGAQAPTAFAGKPSDPTVGYGLFGTQVLRSTFVDDMGHVDAIPIAQDDVAPVQINGQLYRRAIAANDFCVFYTGSHGLAMVPDLDGKPAPGRVLYTPPAGAHVLGVQVAPALNMGQTGNPEQPMLYFTVFAPMDAGGGLYMMDLPPECGGPTTPTPAPDAGDALPDAGTSSGDGGSGPADASVMCANIGQDCSMMPCCANQGVCTDVPLPDGGTGIQCK